MGVTIFCSASLGKYIDNSYNYDKTFTISLTLFGVAFDPSANNNSNGGFSYAQLNQSTGISMVNDKEKVLYKTFNVLGQEVNADEVRNEIIIYVYSDGTSEKKYISSIEE